MSVNDKELFAAFAALPPLKGEAPDYTWRRHRLSLREHVAAGDLSNMLQWSTVVATMFVGTGAAFTPAELSRLTDRYKNIIGEPRIGDPQLYDGWTSGNLIHQAYHLMQWEQATGLQVERLGRIVEIGGGYGAMALLCWRLGFRGRYVIIDLPEVSLLQEYYLSQARVKNVEWRADGLGYEDADLLIALYSITEMEVGDRWEVMERINARHVLMCHQPTFTPFKGQVDNVAWVNEVIENYGGNWVRRDVDLPMLGGHQYVMR